MNEEKISWNSHRNADSVQNKYAVVSVVIYGDNGIFLEHVSIFHSSNHCYQTNAFKKNWVSYGKVNLAFLNSLNLYLLLLYYWRYFGWLFVWFHCTKIMTALPNIFLKMMVNRKYCHIPYGLVLPNIISWQNR